MTKLNRPNEWEIQEALNAMPVVKQSILKYAWKHKDAVRVLMDAGRLFEKVPGSPAPHTKDWRNVPDHCDLVSRSTSALAELLGTPEEGRTALEKTAYVHDWKKRIDRKPQDFTEEQKEKGAQIANAFLDKFDPDRRLLDATEPKGLSRFTRGLKGEYLEGEEPVSSLEKYMHVLDLSILPNGTISTVDDRIAELRVRQANLGDAFWDEKLIAAKAHEQDILQELKDKGYRILPGMRLNEIIGRAAGIPIAA